MRERISALKRKLYYSPYFFTIALRRRTTQSIVSESSFQAEYVVPSMFRNWVADPVLVDYEGETYLFYEAVTRQKGRIEVAKVRADCTLSEPVIVLEDSCHYSYPFVFCHDGTWYMIPESSEAEEVRLYRAVQFPGKWECETVLLRQKAVDTTVFDWEGKMYLLTYMTCPGSERVVPQAYQMEWDGTKPDLKQLSWASFDTLECRGAGPVFTAGNCKIRPAQKNQEHVYGNGLLFYEIECPGREYREKLVGSLSAKDITVKNVYMDGLHTYTGSERFEAIDIRCREPEPGKLLRVIKNTLRKK